MASFSNFKSTIVEASNTAAGITAGVTVYATRANLPTSANAGDQAYVTENNRLYIWNGNGWYNIALINLAPSIQSVLDSDGGITPFLLSTEGVVTTITITATDSDGDPITYTAEADSDFSGLATISNVDNVFTVTPFSQDSASTTSGTITFKADDGINIASSGIQTFTLFFLSPYWDETVLSIGTSSTNGLNNSTFIDRSTNAHTVTPTGSPVQTAFHPYLENWSVEFDGSDDYLGLPSASEFDFESGDFTIETWLYATSSLTTNNRTIIDTRPSSGVRSNNYNFYISTSGKLVFAFSDDGGDTLYESTSTLTSNNWTHVAVARSGDTIRLFVNGSVENTSSVSGKSFNSSLFHVGYKTFSTSSLTYWVGNLSNLRIIKGTALYTANFTPPTVKLTAVSGTSLLTCQSNRFIDNSTNGHTITVNGNPEVFAYNPFGQGSEYALGENKGSVLLDGSSDYMTISNTTAFDFSSGYTCVEAWIYPNSIATGGGRNHIFTRGQSVSPYNGVYLRLENGYPDLAGSGSDLQSPTICKAYEWSHLVFQFNPNGEQSIWLNGVRVADRSNGPSTVEVDVTNGIGHYDGGSIFDGHISDLKIRNGVSAFYSGATITVPQSPLDNTNASLYLPMDNAGIFDKTGNHTLTLLGDTSTSTTQIKYADTSLSLGGSGDGVNIGDNTTFKFLHDKTVDYTIEGWIYSFGTSGRRSIVMTGAASANSGALMEINEGLLEYTIYRGVSGSVTNINAGSINANTWYHIALSVDSNTIRFFLDGNLVNTVTWSLAGSTAVTQSASLSLGRDSLSTVVIDFSGYIENFQILKGVAKYTASFTPPISTQGRTYQAES